MRRSAGQSAALTLLGARDALLKLSRKQLTCRLPAMRLAFSYDPDILDLSK